MIKTTCFHALAVAALSSSAWAAQLLVPDQFQTIQDAIDAAQDGDEVILAPGNYVGLGNFNADFSGKNITVRSADRDPTTVTVNGVSAFRGFLFQNGETSDARLEGITIRDCTAPSQGVPEGLGGGVFINGASPTIVNCRFFNNDADRGGGAFASGDAVFQDCVFGAIGDGNSASTSGGGLFIVEGDQAQVLNCDFIGNNSTFGGGLLLQGSTTLVRDCEFRNNSVIWFGGGVELVAGSEALIENCIFEENMANFGGAMDIEESAPTVRNCFFGDPNDTNPGNEAEGRGGAIYFFETDEFRMDPVITNCQFIGNVSQFGGAIYTEKSSPLIEDSVFGSETQVALRRNTALVDGGAIFNFDDSEPVIRNCAFLGNRANCGGAVANDGSSPEFFDSVFGVSGTSAARNTAIDCGGGIYSFNQSAPVFTRCEFFENQASSDGGAALATANAVNIFVESVFTGNRAKRGGALAARGDDSAVIAILSKFAANEADRGGALEVADSGDGRLIGCLLRANIAEGDNFDIVNKYGGGGAAFTNATGLIVNCTLVGNQSLAVGPSDGGGGVLSESSDVEIANTILWDNITATGASEEEAQLFTGAGESPVVSYSLVQGLSGFNGETNTGLDPGFLDASAQDYRLAPGSAAIDSGNNQVVPLDDQDVDGDLDMLERLPFDLAGEARFVDVSAAPNTGASDGQNPIVDMGAFEATSCPADFDGDGAVGASDLSALLGSWGPDGGVGDLNGDGGVGAFDLAELLSSWGPCS